MTRLLRYLIIAVMVCAVPVNGAIHAQQAKVNQKKIARDKKKREKEAQHDYREALKRHHNNQSKETKAMMKRSKKESKKNTPVRKK